MRLWSVHPKYLDPQGLVALWREGLLAKKVLEGNTRGYKNHPQLDRFKLQKNPIQVINDYLHCVCDQADKFGYKFDRSKLAKRSRAVLKITVTSGQIEFERGHLLKKLYRRNRALFSVFRKSNAVSLHPLFKKRKGVVEDWERI